MGIDHVIDLDCVPKHALTTPGLLARLKARTRAEAIIQLHRDHGDQRPPADMGFEMVRRMPDGKEEVQTVLVRDLLDEAAALDSLEPHCADCPANRAGRPFGCFDNINYPISQKAELWLLKQLPGPDDVLPLMLLRRTLTDYLSDGAEIVRIRQRPGVIFQTGERFARRIDDVQIATDQVFELLFLPEVIAPAHAALLLLFFGAIPRDMAADELMHLTQASPDHATRRDVPFLLSPDPADDETIAEIKAFFAALHAAYRLDVPLSLDA
jgi:hypothetical protein